MGSCCEKSEGCQGKKGDGVQQVSLTVALVGNPNCGKTTLFNALTSALQRVGNWSGVTVERKMGYFTEAGTTVELIDLPGVYSLTLASETAAIDERIACEFILKCKSDVIVNIVDASNLERHLYLTTQLIEMGVPMILALNMQDVARAREIQVDVAKLSAALGCPVIAMEANKGIGIKALQQALVSLKRHKSTRTIPYGAQLESAISELTAISTENISTLRAIRLLEDDVFARKHASPALLEKVKQTQLHIQQTLHEDADILLADARYQFINQQLQTCLSTPSIPKITWTKRIDNIVLNRVLGIPIFLAVMYCLFLFAINIGGAFQDFFDISTQTIFVDGFGYLLTQLGSPAWLTALLANGAGKGINTTVTFIPVIGAMFIFLALLEDSGYMARAAFVVDRLMRVLGLPGKAFVPMIVGFGCNVPAVMAARSLENKRDRILTIMMSPFMSCGARLAIYAVFTAAFFPRGGQNVVFALYLTGVIAALFTGFILRKTLLKGYPAPLVMELPPYHMPNIKTLFMHAWQRLKGFIYRAGRLIVPGCVVIGALNAINLDGSINSSEGDASSLLSIAGQWATPLFAPIGMHTDNWPATVGLVTGILAKEVVVGTLNTLYTQMGHFAAATSVDGFQFWAGIKAAFESIPQNIAQLSNAFGNPILAKAPIGTVNQGVYGLMYEKFDGQAGAFAYLLFILLYFPCISTTAAMLRELHRGWSIFSAFWMTGVAYSVAVIFYQAATFTRHPFTSSMWIISVSTVFISTLLLMRWYASANVKSTRHVSAIPINESY